MTKRQFMYGFFCGLCLTVLFSCVENETIEAVYMPSLMEIPKGFPNIDFPQGNEFTKARWELGKRLFFDPILSVDSTISCATCHQPELAFTDGLTTSKGVSGRDGTRNTPSLANIAYHPYFTREGGVPTLEMQVLVPIQEHNEFDFNIVLIAERLVADETYVQMSQTAYSRTPDAFVITRALACFERSLLSGYSPYDQYIQDKNKTALSEKSLEGMDLFFSEKTNCATCHGGFDFTNYAFENNGLYENYQDEGRFRLTGQEEDRALFKVPSLRNVALTAPYMHDASFSTLEEIVAHYNNGGAAHFNKNTLIKPLNLTMTEQASLVAFLESLSDDTFITNPIFTK